MDEKAPTNNTTEMPVESSPEAGTLENTASPSAGEAVTVQVDDQAILAGLGVNTVYLMGTSFILGVLFTVFVLLMLDFMRRNAEDQK